MFHGLKWWQLRQQTALNEGRLLVVHRISTRIRKTAQSFNHVATQQHRLALNSYERQNTSEKQVISLEKKPYQEAFLQLRGIQKTLKRRKTEFIKTQKETHDDKPPEVMPKYGHYEGLRIESLKDDVQRLIEESHPSMRRLEKARRSLVNCERDGKVLADQEAEKRLSDILQRPFHSESPRNPTPPNSPRTMFGGESEGVKDEKQKHKHDLVRLPPIRIERWKTMGPPLHIQQQQQQQQKQQQQKPQKQRRRVSVDSTRRKSFTLPGRPGS